MSAPRVRTVDELEAEEDSFATPVTNPKLKVKMPASAPGRSKASTTGGGSKKKDRTAGTASLSPIPKTVNQTGDLKKTPSKTKKKAPVKAATAEADNWSLSPDQGSKKTKTNDDSQTLPPDPPLIAKRSNSAKKGLRDETLLRRGSSRTAVTQGDTDSSGIPRTPVSRKKALNRQGSSDVSRTSAGSRRPPGSVTPNGRSKSPGPLNRRSASSRSPGPLNRGSSHRGSVYSASQSPRTPSRRTAEGAASRMTTLRASSANSPLRSNSMGAGLSPPRRSVSQAALGGPPLTPGVGAPMTPGGAGKRSLDPTTRKSPGPLLDSERYSAAAASTRIMTPRTPKSPAKRSVLGGRRATTGLDEAGLKKLAIGPLDDDPKKGTGSDASEGEEEVEVVKRVPFPKTDEEWEAFEKPPKSLVVVWVVVMCELVFDMGTTMIAFRAFSEEGDCCGYPVTIGVYPALMTTPFFCLVSSEIALLLRAILLTMWPDMMKPIDLAYLDSDEESDDDGEEKTTETLENGGYSKKAGSDSERGARGEDKEQPPSIKKEEDNFEDEDVERKKREDDDDDDDDNKKFFNRRFKRRLKRTALKYFCCWLRWKARMLMHILNFLVLLNPFFGCFVAWVLMYQSDRNEAFVVLALEAGSLALHYISIYIEGAITNLWDFFLHGLVPLVPFVTAVSLVLFYLKQGGVCYLVEDKIFKFAGCEVCINGYPPVDGICYLKDGTNYTFVATDLLSAESYNSLEDVISRSSQVSYCAGQNPAGPDVNFCFFDFEEGQKDGLVIEASEAPTSLAVLSSSKCGATVGTGEKELDCRRYLWNPTQDESMFCFAFGGLSDPCHLNIENDGVNYGRFKDPSGCRLARRPDGDYLSYGDVFYLWDDPSSYGFDFRWAANAWVAYSITRWALEMASLRSQGLKVSTPLVTFQDQAQVVSDLSAFFDNCSPHCDDPESNAYVDLLAVNVFCDPSTETCSEKVATVADFLRSLSSQYNNRPVHITQWGVRDSTEAPVLLSAMDSTPGFFTDGSTVERVYWYGGDSPDTTNLRIEARQSRLGRIWAETCADINEANIFL